MQGAFGGHRVMVAGTRLHHRELAGGLLGGLAYVGLSSTRRHAALTSLAPADTEPTVEKIAEGDVMKKLINAPDSVVTDALAGVAAAHPSLAVDIENKVITRAGGPTPGKVGLVSGGGSGHEPLHGGFVGYGMLDAACPGEVFTSPVPGPDARRDQGGQRRRRRAAHRQELHRRRAQLPDGRRAAPPTRASRSPPVVVNDDVAVQDSLYTAGRRGVGATVFVEKIAGALAERGAPLAEVAAVAAEVNERSRSFGVALTSCTVPAAGKPTFELADSRDRARHRHPRRARPHPRPAAPRPARSLAVAHGRDPRRPAAGRRPAGHGQRHGRHPADRAVRASYNEVQQVRHRQGRADRQEPGRQLHHQPGDAGLLGDRVPPDRHARELWDAPVDTPALRWGR